MVNTVPSVGSQSCSTTCWKLLLGGKSCHGCPCDHFVHGWDVWDPFGRLRHLSCWFV